MPSSTAPWTRRFDRGAPRRRVDEQENRIEYWLKLVQSYGEGSPVVVVCNKCDQHRLELARRRLQEKYPTLKGFYETSCKTGEGIGALRDALHALIDGLDHVRDALPEPWFEVKSALEQMTESFVSLGRFQEICAGMGVAAASEQRTLLRLCHDLGTVLSFQDDPRLQDTNVLRPDWVTDGVYKILNWNELFQAKGVLDLRRLGELLAPGAYPRGTHPFLIDMMRKFELCFPFAGPGAEERYLVPALLPKDEPDTGSWDDALIIFEYHYDVLPPSVISRFLVRMHENISQKTSWRSGALLADGNDDRAFVRADTTDGTVEIRVRGGPFSARTFLAKIRGNLEVVQGPPLSLQVSAKVVVMAEGKRVAVDYDDLVRHEEEGIETILVPGTRTKANVSDLLNGVRTAEERLRRVRHTDPMELDPPRTPGQEQEPPKVRSDEPAPEPEKPLPRPPSAWVNGSFYLVAVVVVLAAITTIAYFFSPVAALAISSVAVVTVGVIGANQLKHDERLKDRSYLALMGMAYKNLLLLQGKKRGPAREPSLPAAKTAAPEAPKLPKQKPAPALPGAKKKKTGTAKKAAGAGKPREQEG